MTIFFKKLNKIFRFNILIDKILPKNKFLKATSILASGSAGTQLITLLAAPILTRLYSVDEFGLLGVFSSIVAIFGVIVVLKYELALPLQSNFVKTFHLAISSAVVVILMTAIFSVFIFLFDDYFLLINKIFFFIDFRWFIIISITLTGIYKILIYLAIKRKIYNKITKANLIQSSTTAFIQITNHGFGISGLIFGVLMGQCLAVISLISNLNKKFFNTKINYNKLHKILLENKNFPLFTSWGGLAHVGAQQSPNILFAILFNPSIAGLIFLIQRLVKAPMVLIGRSISDVVLIQGHEALKKKQLLKLIEDIFFKLLKISVPSIIFLSLVSENLFGFIFGKNWSQAGELILILTPYIILQFCTFPLHSTFQILNKQKQGSLFQLLLFISVIIGILIGYEKQSVYLSIFLYSTFGSIIFIFMFVYLWKEIGGSLTYLFKNFLKEIFIGIMLNVPIIFYKFEIFVNNSEHFLNFYSFVTILLIFGNFYRNRNEFR